MNENDLDTVDPDAGNSDALIPGTTLLQGQYIIEKFLNSGGFGMTYLARDSLDRTVVIKECFPASFCSRNDNVVRARSKSQQSSFKSIVELFVREARRLSKLEHANIVGVHQVFEDNETAYMALDYVQGQDMFDAVSNGKMRVGQDNARQILLKVLQSIAYVHDEGVLHRDISPDNILLERSGNPILIDFGAAREQASKKSRALSALMVVKDGYSPQEFYVAGSEQGPSSDLYSLGATFYHFLTGEAPANSQTRLAAVAAQKDDPYVALSQKVKGYDREFLQAIDTALNIFPKDRHQCAQDWIVQIDSEQRIATALEAAKQDRNMDREISKLVVETNRAVKIAVAEAAKQTKKQAAIKKAPPVRKPFIILDPEEDEIVASSEPVVRPERVTVQAARTPQVAARVQSVPVSAGLFRRATKKRSIWRFWASDKPNDEHLGRVS